MPGPAGPAGPGRGRSGAGPRLRACRSLGSLPSRSHATASYALASWRDHPHSCLRLGPLKTGQYARRSPGAAATGGRVLLRAARAAVLSRKQDPRGRVLVSVYTSGAIRRLVPGDVPWLVSYMRERAASVA
jgi:hypothetical protein